MEAIKFKDMRFYPFLFELRYAEIIKANNIVKTNPKEAINHILMLTLVTDYHEFLTRKDKVADPVYYWSSSWQPI